MASTVTGTLERNAKSGGRLRQAKSNYASRKDDVIVTSDLCQELGLRGGETLIASCGPSKGRRPPAVSRSADVESINGLSIDEHLKRIPFEELTAIDPRERVRFETEGGPVAMRVVDLLTPIGLGQRGLIVAAPRTGKTILLQQMAEAKDDPGGWIARTREGLWPRQAQRFLHRPEVDYPLVAATKPPETKST